MKRPLNLGHLGVLCVMTTFALACPQQIAIWLADGASSKNLEFVFGREEGKEEPVRFDVLSVAKCRKGQPVSRPFLWTITTKEEISITDYPTRVVYGIVPKGFSQSSPATELTPGCYMAFTGGSGGVTFTVDSAGLVARVSGDSIKP
jgi:hypothetical protein